MSQKEERICVISLSRRDPTFRFIRGIGSVIKWLEGKREPPHRYFFCGRKPKNGLPKGSIMLFSFEGQVFGQALVQEDIKAVPLNEEVNSNAEYHNKGYKHFLTLDPANLEIFHFHPTKEKIAEQTDLRFAQLFTYIKSDEYQQILKMAKR